MFIEIDESVDELIIGNNQPAIDFIDSILTAHRMGNVLLILNRKQVGQYQACDSLSGLSRRTIGLLSTRRNDYKAALRSASRSLLVCAPGKENNISWHGSVVRVSFRILDLHHLMTQKFFLAEGPNDVEVLGFLIDEYLTFLGYPKAYVTYRPLIGGGGTLPHVLAAEAVTPAKGMVICDRDRCDIVPPFTHNTTIQKAVQEAQRQNLIGETLGISDNSPFFGIDVTWGRTIENMVGPNVVDVFLESQGRRAERAIFTAAFDMFPVLTEADRLLWRYLNLKSGTAVLTDQLAALRKELGSVPAAVTGRLDALTKVALPKDLLLWIGENRSAQRWTSALRKAVQDDLQDQDYRHAVEAIALPMLTLAAGDSTARRS